VTLLSRKADYALLILSYLSEKPGTARAIAEKFGMRTKHFVANILKELCHRGFVKSHRGVKGGYTLARPTESITLAELLESLEEGFHLAVCTTHEPDHECCSLASTCTLKGQIAVVHHKLLEVLRGVTLAELFNPDGSLSHPSALLSLPLVSPAAAGAVETPLA
jgi:Rrf2 family nitric oxide-sensitive transcriptional repressor